MISIAAVSPENPASEDGDGIYGVMGGRGIQRGGTSRSSLNTFVDLLLFRGDPDVRSLHRCAQESSRSAVSLDRPHPHRFRGLYVFRFEPSSGTEGRTIFVQEESFMGMLAFAMSVSRRPGRW